jgi:hypothetical protein
MTGRYRISLAKAGQGILAERTTRKRWSVFVRTCESLAADGLPYCVSFVLTGADPHILIAASGWPVAKRQRASVRRLALVPPIKAQQCAVHALEAEWFLPENQERRNASTTHWRTRASRYAELNAMAEEHLRADLEYWRELERISGQREHFKPGLTDETAWADDEVAA